MGFIRFAVLLVCAALLILPACDIIVPPDPPLESQDVSPDDFAWVQLDITQKYEYIDVARIDCPKIATALASFGKCLPVMLPIGPATECPMAYPAKKLQLACLTDQTDTPAVYARLELDSKAMNLDFQTTFGPCEFIGLGPAAGQTSRYATDTGFKACLFKQKAPYSGLYGDSDARPMGLYLDVSDNPKSPEQLKQSAQNAQFDAPAALMMDARFLNKKDRIQALNDLNLIFSFYRSFAPKAEPAK